MNELSRHIGRRMRQFRKAQGLTLQQMADQLNKSKATMSKYETGDIILDIETLSAAANLLQVSISQLTDYRPETEILPGNKKEVSSNETPEIHPVKGQSPFFTADKLYFYYYDGRYRRLKEGTIRIHRADRTKLSCTASAVISSGTPMGRSSEEYYTGDVLYSEMVIRFTFTNQHNALEQNTLYLFNPPEDLNDLAHGLLSGLSTADQIPCAFKCMVSLTPQDMDLTGSLMRGLTFTKRELQLLQKRNMLLADSQE